MSMYLSRPLAEGVCRSMGGGIESYGVITSLQLVGAASPSQVDSLFPFGRVKKANDGGGHSNGLGFELLWYDESTFCPP